MFTTKKDVDKHVRTGFAKLRTENEKNLRGYSVAKIYARIGEYTSALHYVSMYLSIKDDSPQAHRLAGQCHEKLKRNDKAIASYQRSLQLDPKQSELLIECCKLVLADEPSQNPAKLRFWCDLAESQHVHHETVVQLKMRLLQRDNFTPRQVDEMLQKEIAAQPTSISLRCQMVKHMLDQNRLDDAFKYVFELEQKQNEFFSQSLDWYNCIQQVLTKLTHADLTSNWTYWLMSVSTIERQTYLTLCASGQSFSSATNLTDCAALLQQFDQTLDKASRTVSALCPDRQLAQQFLVHFRGQLCLHAASLIFKRENLQKTHWREIQRNTLPLLLLASNAGVVNTDEKWVGNSTESIQQLVRLWHRESSFRCLQAGRALLASIDTSKESTTLANIRKICTDRTLCTNNAELLDQIRQYCSDSDWRRNIYRSLFPGASDQATKQTTSFLVQSTQLAEPTFELPRVTHLETYTESAQWLRPSSLDHQVYLALGSPTLADYRCNVFNSLNVSVSNLAHCGAESLSQLDVDSVLAAATMQTELRLSTERSIYEVNGNRSSDQVHRPFAIVAHSLATEEQSSWWLAAYKVFKNLSTTEDLGEVRATLQYGIEAVRGVGGPKMDLLICLKLGQLFVARTNQPDIRSTDKIFLETRAEALFKFALHMFRLKNTGSLGQYRPLFKYNTQNAFETDCTVNAAAEEAVTFVASRFFQAGEYQECIDELQNVQLPFATYFLAESYRKLGQTTNTPKKNQRGHVEKAKEFLQQTLELLDHPHVDKNHALRSIVHDDLKSLQQQLSKHEVSFTNGNHLVERDSLNDSQSSASGRARSVRDVRPIEQPKFDELKMMMTKMMETLSIVQDDVLDVRTRLGHMEEKLNRKQESDMTTPSDNDIFGDDFMKTNSAANYASPHFFNSPVGPVPMHPYNAQFYNNIYQQMAFPQLRNPMPQQAPINYADPNLSLYNLPPQLDPRNSNILNLLQQPPQFQTHSPTQFTPAQNNVAFAPTPQIIPPPTIQSFNTPTQSQPSHTVAQPVEIKQQTPPNFPKTWNTANNNAPVEKAPPVNVVITSSDPLPLQSTVSAAQPTLSVTIPSHHIKNQPQITPAEVAPQSSPLTFGGFVKTPTSLTSKTNKVAEKSTPTPVEKPKISEPTPSEKPKPKTTVENASAKPSPFGALNFSKTPDNPATEKPNPFASFSFGTTPTAKPFASFAVTNAFGSATSTTVAPSPVKPTEPVAAAVVSQNETEVDDYVPTAHFEPVIALPDLVDTKTGEEEEHIRFEHRAKLLRFVKETKEWKERGIGTMKVLVQKKDANKVRLLMRREQVLKLCCNQLLTKDMKFDKLGPAGTSLSWCGQDYSENELQTEVLAIRFKNADVCKQFLEAVLEAQRGMANESGGGDADTIPVKKDEAKKTDAKKVDAEVTIGFGNKFKPASGSWDCKTCYVTNKASDLKCLACNEPSPNAAPAPTPTSKPPTQAAPPKAGLGFGDKFKPKSGAWECKACYISNTGDVLHCVACDSPKDDTVPPKPKEHSLLATSAGAPKFSFGVPMAGPAATVTTSAPPASVTASAPPAAVANSGAAFSFGTFTAMSNTPNSNIFANPASSSTPAKSLFGGFAFGLPAVAPSPAPVAVKSEPVPIPTLSNEKESFSFVFKPKSPGKGKSPLKSYVPNAEDVSDDENIEEENNTYFTPAIPLPDKVEVVTGEESETILYSHRAKLYRFADAEWKERGLGDVKILKHKTTNNLRVVMRRDQILKICLNHALTTDIDYQPKDDKSWHFVAQDFSEGTLELMQFCLRFKNTEIAAGFKSAVDAALSGSLVEGVVTEENSEANVNSSLAIISDEDKKLADSLKLPINFYAYKNSATQCTGCRGCQTPDFQFAELKQINLDVEDENPLSLVHPISLSKRTTPQKSFVKANANPNQSSIFSGTNLGGESLFGTATAPTTDNIFGNADKQSIFASAQKSVFGGIGNVAQNGAKPLPSQSFTFGIPTTESPFKTFADTTKTGADETFSFKSTALFGQAATLSANTTSDQPKSIFGGSNLFKATETNTGVSSTTNFTETPKSVFGDVSIFNTTNTYNSPTETPKSVNEVSPSVKLKPATVTATPLKNAEPTSIFAQAANAANLPQTDTSTTSSFNNSAEPKSVFGGAAVFKPADKPEPKGTGPSIFSNSTTGSIFGFANENATAPAKLPSEVTKDTLNESAEPIFKDSGISFAALATSNSAATASSSDAAKTFSFAAPSESSSGFFGLSKHNDFSSFSKPTSADTNGSAGHNDSAGGEDPNYDPHYDPIIELPDEIVVRTGEEDEVKVFGDRAKLYRYDTTNREWKERGVGELKILHHPIKNTYRLLLRREQVHKCVLNHAINGDFNISPMQSSDKAFCWATNNFADDPAGVPEQLSVRFKNSIVAGAFDEALKKCMSQLKLEPQDD